VYLPAVSYDGHQVAALDKSGHTVTVTDTSSSAVRATLHAKLKDGVFSRPSWDVRGNVWAVESNAKGSRLWEIAGGTTKTVADGWTLSSYPVKALRISRDGTRAAAIVQVGHTSQVQLGRVDRAPSPSGGLQAEGFIAINSELQGAVDLAWRDADNLVVVGGTSDNPSPGLYDVPVSGAAIQGLVGPGGDMKSVAAYPGAALLVTRHVTNQHQDDVCRLSDKYGDWKCYPRTSDPAYPG
jgi:WD40 repeat protein